MATNFYKTKKANYLAVENTKICQTKRTPFLKWMSFFFFFFSTFANSVSVAQETVNDGSTIVSGGTYQFEENATGVLTISTTESVIIIGNGELIDMRINCNVAGVNLTIRDLNITLTSTSFSAIIFTGTDNTLILEGENVLYDRNVSTMASSAAIVRVNNGTELTITGSGQLTVTTKRHGAGIGANANSSSGAITIHQTTVFAYAYLGGSAIGAAYPGAQAGNILIDESRVVVETFFTSSAPFCAGIGGGSIAQGGNITIVNSDVTATTNTYGAAIGTGVWGGNTNIRIISSTVNAATTTGSAAIGNGYGTDQSTPNGSRIYIEGSDVIATSTNTSLNHGGAAIGGSARYVYFGIYGGPASSPAITIVDSEIHATAAGYGAAIGSGSNNGGDAIENNGSVTITDSKIYAESGHGAAIGGGLLNSGGNITISGDNTEVTAIGGSNSAAIGSGSDNTTDIVQGGTLTINDAPEIMAYAYGTNGAILGVEVGGQAKVVQGSLIENLIDEENSQNIFVNNLQDSNERYVLELPAGYSSFAVNAGRSQTSEQYISYIERIDNDYVLAKIIDNGGNEELLYIYDLENTTISSILNLQRASLESENPCVAVIPLTVTTSPTAVITFTSEVPVILTDVTAKGFQYRLRGTETWTSIATPDSFTTTVNSLPTGTYEVRAFVQTSACGMLYSRTQRVVMVCNCD